MSQRTDLDFLADIQEAITRIVVYTQNLTYDMFLNDAKTQDAVIRNLEVMGEATKNISNELRHCHPDLPWKGMAGIRDRLIHHYFGVNLDIIWNIISTELPSLSSQIQEILDK
ncbi:MAG TPA: DUF86 domain-containing protein [Anaerolineae bacterium]|nr:DUF86 domain-containing protein [Anaerolineae bacterium]HMR67496.1 DUF86 domain-containing protein [Anaerolineae bacterium]